MLLLRQVAQPGDVVFLHGELGAGKTSLSRGFLRHFFADPVLEVPSPSYLICFTYTDRTPSAAPTAAADRDASGGPGTKSVGQDILHTVGTGRLPGVNVLHLDPYRLPEGKVASLIDLAPAFERHICLIEWPERLGPELVNAVSPSRLELTLGGIGPQAQGRLVSMRAVGERWRMQLTAWHSAGKVDVALPPPPARSDAASACALSGAPHLAEEKQVGVFPKGDPSKWLVLGIESSCDDTGAAVVRGDGTVLADVLASQAGIHEVWGGVVPKLAQAAHSAAIDHTVDEVGRSPPLLSTATEPEPEPEHMPRQIQSPRAGALLRVPFPGSSALGRLRCRSVGRCCHRRPRPVALPRGAREAREARESGIGGRPGRPGRPGRVASEGGWHGREAREARGAREGGMGGWHGREALEGGMRGMRELSTHPPQMLGQVGVKKAVALTKKHQLLLVRTHHMESHAMVL